MFVEAEVWTIVKTEVGHAVLVRPLGGKKAVPIVIGAFEVQSIILGQSTFIGLKETITRPMTHDLMLSLVHILSGKVSRVGIYKLEEGIYYANIFLDQNGKELIVDSRPSDALALALRAHCPIYIEDSIVDQVGVESESIQRSPEEEHYSPEEVQEEIYEEVTDDDENIFPGADAFTEEQIGPMNPSSQENISRMTQKELEERLQYCVENELYEEAARIRDLLKNFD